MRCIFVAATLLCVLAFASGQTERCGLLGDCVCRDSCDNALEEEDGLGSLFCSTGTCCCATVQCGFLDFCDCRADDCEEDEDYDFIFGCEDSNLWCCCQEDGGSGDGTARRVKMTRNDLVTMLREQKKQNQLA